MSLSQYAEHPAQGRRHCRAAVESRSQGQRPGRSRARAVCPGAGPEAHLQAGGRVQRLCQANGGATQDTFTECPAGKAALPRTAGRVGSSGREGSRRVAFFRCWPLPGVEWPLGWSPRGPLVAVQDVGRALEEEVALKTTGTEGSGALAGRWQAVWGRGVCWHRGSVPRSRAGPHSLPNT